MRHPYSPVHKPVGMICRCFLVILHLPTCKKDQLCMKARPLLRTSSRAQKMEANRFTDFNPPIDSNSAGQVRLNLPEAPTAHVAMTITHFTTQNDRSTDHSRKISLARQTTFVHRPFFLALTEHLVTKLLACKGGSIKLR